MPFWLLSLVKNLQPVAKRSAVPGRNAIYNAIVLKKQRLPVQSRQPLSVKTLRGGRMRACVPAGACWSCHPRVSKHIRLLPAACLHIHCHDGTGNLFLYSACSCPPQQNNRWGMAPAPVILRVFRRKTRALSWYNIKFFLQLLFIKNPTGIRADYFQIFI